MADPVTITSREAAALLGETIETFYRAITDRKANHGFPAPIPGSRRYSRAAVLAWINRAGLPTRPAPSATSTLEQDVAACEATLLSRAHAMAAAG